MYPQKSEGEKREHRNKTEYITNPYWKDEKFIIEIDETTGLIMKLTVTVLLSVNQSLLLQLDRLITQAGCFLSWHSLLTVQTKFKTSLKRELSEYKPFREQAFALKANHHFHNFFRIDKGKKMQAHSWQVYPMTIKWNTNGFNQICTSDLHSGVKDRLSIALTHCKNNFHKFIFSSRDHKCLSAKYIFVAVYLHTQNAIQQQYWLDADHLYSTRHYKQDIHVQSFSSVIFMKTLPSTSSSTCNCKPKAYR